MMGALAATTLVLAADAAPAAAAAAIDPLKRCYVSAGEEEQRRETVAVRGTGFTANSFVDIAVDGVVQASGFADPVGDLKADVKAPHQPRGQRRFTVTVAERGNPANVATATTNGTIYAHYLFGGRERRSVRVARPHGDCGTFAVRRRQIPIRRPRTGDWTLQVDQRREYSDAPGTNWVRLLIRVRQFFRPV